MASNSATLAEYIYDFKGKRIIKKNYLNGSLANTVTSWTPSYETKAIEGGGTEETVYYYANGELVAKKNPDDSIYYIHSDHLGSSSVITNQAGSLVESTTYDPWGEVLSGGTSVKYQYTGQEKDSETGLNYYGARYYGSDIQHFIQPDPIIPNIYNPQNLNRYAYAANNPLRYVDPTGHVQFDLTSSSLGRVTSFGSTPPKKKSGSSPYLSTQAIAASISQSSKPKNTGSNSSSSNSTTVNRSSSVSNSGGSSSGGGGTPQNPASVMGSNISSQGNTSTSPVRSSTTNSGIVGVCANGSAGVGVYGTASVCGVYSLSENRFGVTGSLGGGGTTGISLDLDVSLQVSNAERFSDILGQDVFTGVSGGELLQGGMQYSQSKDNPNIKTVEPSFGIGGKWTFPTVPGEFYGGSSYTWGHQF